MKEYEDIDNIQLVCKECSDNKLNDFQEFFDTCLGELKSTFLMNFVKAIDEGRLYFKCYVKSDGVTEYMWFKVTDFNYYEDYFKGTLDNTPFIVEGYEFGDICELKFSDVSDYIM